MPPPDFFQLFTSEGRPRGDELPAILDVYDYLEHVRTGMQGKPMCPFVEAVHRGDGYHVKIYQQSAERVDFRQVADELHGAFRRISPSATVACQPLDITATVAAFAGRGCR